MRRDARGSAVVEFLWLTVLFLIPLTYVVLTVLTAQRAAFAASAAARGAARAFLGAPDPATARTRAEIAARLAFADQGVDRPFDLEIDCVPDAARCLAPGARIRVRVRARVALPLVPDAFGGTPPAISVAATTVEPYGSYRQARP